MTKNYSPIIGMEVHVELATKSKMFCACPANHFQIPANTHTCPVCLGLPGALPVPNKQAIEDAIKIGLALGCSVNLESKFDRKHYFYPDLPKGYQISQYDEPLCEKGAVILSNGRKIRITRVHLEEDTGKLQHKVIDGKPQSLIDFNRSGVPLVEIVTEPDLTSAEEAKEYLKLIHSTVRFLGVSDADMEKGSMRLEANISVSMDGSLPDFKVEVKNVNSFRYISTAIDYEIKRQTKLLEEKKKPAQETRGWSVKDKRTVLQRTKETAKDYRYFPEPDIPRMVFTQSEIEKIKTSLPLLPKDVISRLVQSGIRPNYAVVASENKPLAEYLLGLVELAKKEKVEVDQLVGDVINSKISWKQSKPEELLGKYLEKRSKTFLDEEETETVVKKVVDQNPKAVADYKKGKLTVIQFLLGMVMAQTKGGADPGVARRLLEKELK